MGKASARDVEIDVLTRDKTSKPVDRMTRAYERMRKTVDRSFSSNTKAASSAQKAIAKITKTVLTWARAVGKAVSTVAALVSLIGPLVVGLLAAGKAIAVFTKGLVGLNPLAAFIPSLAGALALVVGTVKLIGPGLSRALEPIKRQFVDAEGNATRFTRRLQDLAAKGVRPLATEFVKVNFPEIARGMERISRSTNKVVDGVGKWVNSAEGQRLIEIITTRTANAVERLAPKIEAAVIALGKLALRAGDKGLQKFADLIGRIIDKFTEWANSTSIEDIKKAISDLSGWLTILRDRFNALREIGRWMAENEGKVRKFASAIAVLGLALGLLGGSWIGVILAGFTLLTLHWDTAKAKLSGAATWWSNLWNGIKNNPAIRELVTEVRAHFVALVAAVRPLWEKFKQDALPALQGLKDVIMRDLIPAVSSFIAAASPIVIWLVTKLGPIVVTTFTMIINVISGALKVIAGIINVITAVIRGDWSKFWQGIRQIVTGNTQIISALVRGVWSAIRGAFSAGIAAALKIASTFGGRLKGLFAGAGSWLKGVGRSIVEGLAQGIRDAAGLVTGAVSGLIEKAKGMIPGPLRGVIPGFAGGDSGWRPARYAAQFAGGGGNFAMAGGGTSRSGGPTPVNVANTVNVALDGVPFYAHTARTVTAAEKRSRWRDRVGKR